jgi:cytochrome c-L
MMTAAASSGRRARAGRRVAAAVAVTVAATFVGAAAAQKPVFRHAFDGGPIDTPLKGDERSTPALEQFKETGVNPYRGQAEAMAAGKKLYEQWCQVCHNSDASGKMGPPLIGKSHVYAQTSDDVGMFAIIYAGASGAMQSFAGRIAQDDMLKIIAYVRSLDR